mgnify:CR=1 FL=1
MYDLALVIIVDGYFDKDDKSTELSFKWTCQHVNLMARPGNRTTPLVLVYSVHTAANTSDDASKQVIIVL